MTNKLPPILSIRDENDLSWFFRQTLYERSTMGYLLERAKLFDLQAPAAPPWPTIVDGEIVYGENEVTARPTAETREQSGHVPDDQELIRFAHVSRRIMQLKQRATVSADVLEAYLGSSGERWALTKQGRIVAVYAHTATGKKLVRHSLEQNAKSGAKLDLSPAERIEVIVLGKADTGRREALARALREAEALLRAAICAWNGDPDEESAAP